MDKNLTTSTIINGEGTENTSKVSINPDGAESLIAAGIVAVALIVKGIIKMIFHNHDKDEIITESEESNEEEIEEE